MTETMEIDLDRELWRCWRCAHEIGPARDNYKEGLLIYERDPTDIHRPPLDSSLYTSPCTDPMGAALEYYCPSSRVMIEVEYLPPGHPPVRDMEFDIDALKLQWKKRKPATQAELNGPTGSARRTT